MASHGVPRGDGTKPANEDDRKKELQRVEDYRNLVGAVNSKIREEEYTRETLALTSKLLRQNPEYYTVWNHRRRIFLHLISQARQEQEELRQTDFDDSSDSSVAALITSDLGFLIPLLRQYPKCYWIWKYRLWLLEQSSLNLTKPICNSIWVDELKLDTKMLSLDSRNFHAWGYRSTVAAAIENIPNAAGDLPGSLTQSELDYTSKMINANLSNFSAWHRRSKLIPRLLDERHADDAERRQRLDSELGLIQRALYTGDNDQSLWFYHQNLMCTFEPRYAAEAMAPNLSTEERVQYVRQEMEKVGEMLDDDDDDDDGAEGCKWIYQALVQLTLLWRALEGRWPEDVAADFAKWVAELEKLDPLRAGRWRELRINMSVGSE